MSSSRAVGEVGCFSHLLLLPGGPRGLLLRLPVGVVDLGVDAVHALGPLPVDHALLLLTATRRRQQRVRRTKVTQLHGSVTRGYSMLSLTSCLGCSLPPCAAPYQTCHMA